MSTVIDPILPREGVAPPRHQPLVVLACAASGGVVLDRYLPHSFAAWWLAAAGALLVWAMLYRARWKTLALAPLLAAVVFGFAARHHARWHLFADHEIGAQAVLDLRPVCLEAKALTNVRWRPAPKADPLRIIPQGDTCRLTVQVLRVRDGDAWRAASGRATLTIDGHLVGVRAGDRLRVLALMHRVPPAQNPGEFDSAYHQRVERELVRLSAASPDCVERLAAGSPYAPRRLLGQLRDACHEQLWQQIQPERAGLASGLLIGSREQIEYEQTQQFFLTGTIHLLAISGVHVGILASGFWAVMRTGVLGRRSAIAAAVAFVAIYTLLADMEPPILRSAILVIIFCFGRWLGRPTPPLNTLAAGALVVLVLNPTEFYQVGTQLSFLAVMTLILCGPLLVVKRSADPLQRLIQNSRPWWWRYSRFTASYVFRLWLTGTVIWLVGLPLTLYRFHVLSWSALALNMLLWLPISLALYTGFAALTIGWLLPPVGRWLGFACDQSLRFIAWMIQWGESAPGSYQWVPGPALWWVVGFYLGLGAYVAFAHWRPKPRWAAALLFAWILLGYVTAERSPLSLRPAREELRCTFVAVGHGTSCLIEFADGRTLLYDGGHMGTPQASANAISAVLWSRGITHLDAIVISHADSDHYNAIPELLERFDVGAIYVSPVMFLDEPGGVKKLRQAIERRKIPLREVYGGQKLALGNSARSEVLHPPRRGVIGSDNANSIVLAIEYAGQRLLLPGDLERNGLVDVLAEEPLPSQIVMAPHHGSASSNPRGFAQWSSPKWVVISGSRSRDATEVIDAYRSYGAEVLHTAHDGALCFTLSSTGLKVETWHDDAWHERRHRGEEAEERR